MVEWHNELLGNVDEFLRENDKFAWYMARKFEQSGNRAGLSQDELHAIAQFGLLKAYQTFRDEAGVKFATYGAHVMTNEINMALRQVKKRALDVSMETACAVDEKDNELTLADMLHGDSDVDISSSWFWDYAKTLRERERLMIQLRLDGLKHDEIGQRLGISQSYVTRILQRILDDYQRGDWKMTAITMTKEEYLAERLAGKNRAQIANDLGLKHQAYLYPKLEKWGIKDKEAEHEAMDEISGIAKPEVTTTAVPKVEPSAQTVVEHVASAIIFTEPKVSVLDRLDALRNKFAECISELTKIENEVRPLLEAKSEMSQVAKKLLELVG